MRYQSQSVAYWYFAVAMVLFGLQLVFGLLSATKYIGPDPLLYILPFDVTKVIHTNLLIVWVLTGFMGATYWMIPEESRAELHSTKLAYVQLVLWTLMGVTAIIGYLFRYGTATLMFLRHRNVRVIALNERSWVDPTYPDRGHTEAQVALTGAESLLPQQAGHYQVRLEWWQEGGEWQLARLEWD